MKKTLFFVAVAMMLGLAGCHNQSQKTTESDVKKAEKALFNEDLTVNAEAAPEAVNTFSNYAKENPEAADAAEYLFKAVEVSINTKQDARQSIELVNKLVTSYCCNTLCIYGYPVSVT